MCRSLPGASLTIRGMSSTPPQIHWQENGLEHSALWRSENASPPPRQVRLADDTLSADAAYRLACEGTALLWRGDFHNARQLLSALGLVTPEPVEIETIAAVDADPEARALLAQVYALLQTLSADDRIAWTLRYVERHRLETVAVMMDCSLATAKRRIARTQRFLTEHFVAPFNQHSS